MADDVMPTFLVGKTPRQVEVLGCVFVGLSEGRGALSSRNKSLGALVKP